MKWFIKCFKQYFDFKGRARRKEYWYFTLFCFIFSILVELVGSILGMMVGSYILHSILSLIFCIITFIPSISVSVRRLHDIGRSGWWGLLCLVPIIGWIWLIVWACFDSQENENQWGPNPKENVI
ncbi:MAG: DUF805 domain-containing protein [Bacteroidales bacterium]|nr:DUF805 domain-containing protein [Bacteroidales bacterium]